MGPRRLDAILRRVGVVGEAAARVPVVDPDRSPGIDWREIFGMRQHVVHGCDKLDLATCSRGVVRQDLPKLVRQLDGLLLTGSKDRR